MVIGIVNIKYVNKRRAQLYVPEFYFYFLPVMVQRGRSQLTDAGVFAYQFLAVA